MARLGCKCGVEMTNTISPSKNRLNVFYIKEVMDAVNSNPQIRLWDFYTGWDEKNSRNYSFQDRKEPVEYWYCTNCKRIYEVQAKSCGKIVRTYYLSRDNYPREIDVTELSELLVLTDVEMDNLLSRSENLTLKEYLAQEKSRKLFISSDERSVYIREKNNSEISVYLRED